MYKLYAAHFFPIYFNHHLKFNPILVTTKYFNPIPLLSGYTAAYAHNMPLSSYGSIPQLSPPAYQYSHSLGQYVDNTAAAAASSLSFSSPAGTAGTAGSLRGHNTSSDEARAYSAAQFNIFC